jgi:predicted DNA-binding protein (MmcQ/YjbR family)
VHDDPGPPTAAHAKAEAKLREFALAYPEATEQFPWGERAIKVCDKTFLFMRADGNGLGLSTKLPESRDFALTHTFAASTGYGLGKAGWVSASFPRGTRPPISLLCEWIDESYRAIAPKRLVKLLPE